jgi:hypothetical protein
VNYLWIEVNLNLETISRRYPNKVPKDKKLIINGRHFVEHTELIKKIREGEITLLDIKDKNEKELIEQEI